MSVWDPFLYANYFTFYILSLIIRVSSTWPREAHRETAFIFVVECNKSAHAWLAFALALFEFSLGEVVQMRSLRDVISPLIWQEDSVGLVTVSGCWDCEWRYCCEYGGVVCFCLKLEVIWWCFVLLNVWSFVEFSCNLPIPFTVVDIWCEFYVVAGGSSWGCIHFRVIMWLREAHFETASANGRVNSRHKS